MEQTQPEALQFYSVNLVACAIEVTAEDAAEATQSGREDAIEFARNWNYVVADIAPINGPADPTGSITSVQPTVVITGHQPEFSEFTLDATFVLTVAASSGYAAGEAALRMATSHPPQLAERLAKYRSQVCAAKIRLHLITCMDSVAQAFHQQGVAAEVKDHGGASVVLTIQHPEGTVHVAPHLVERHETSPKDVTTFGAYYALAVFDDTDDILHCLHPVDLEDLWLNDRPLLATDIDWLDPREMLRQAAIGIRAVMARSEDEAPTP